MTPLGAAVVAVVALLVTAGVWGLRRRRLRELAAAEEADRLRREEEAARLAGQPGRRIARTLGSYAKASLGLLAEQVLLDDLDRSARSGRPVGIMFADLAGSTALNVEVGDRAFAALMAAHDRVTEEAVRAHGGQVVKRLGDGFMALFADVAAAVEGARAVREALRDNPDVGRPLRVRIGLHAASVVTDRGDYYGEGVATAARVAERAAPDQILLTTEVVDHFDGRLARGAPITVELAGLPGRRRLHPLEG